MTGASFQVSCEGQKHGWTDAGLFTLQLIDYIIYDCRTLPLWNIGTIGEVSNHYLFKSAWRLTSYYEAGYDGGVLVKPGVSAIDMGLRLRNCLHEGTLPWFHPRVRPTLQTDKAHISVYIYAQHTVGQWFSCVLLQPRRDRGIGTMDTPEGIDRSICARCFTIFALCMPMHALRLRLIQTIPRFLFVYARCMHRSSC